MSYISITLLTLSEIIGDFGFKEFANKGGIKSFAFGTFGYIGVIYFLIVSLQNSQVLLVNAAWDGISALIESMAAIYFLREGFSDPYQYLGIVLIVLGLFFLKMPMVSPHKFIFPKIFSS